MLKNYKCYLQNLDCANCAKKIETTISKDERFSEVVVNFNLLTLTFESSMEGAIDEVKSIIKGIEPEIVVQEELRDDSQKNWELERLILACLLLVISFFIKNDVVKEIITVLVYGLLLYKTFLKALKKIIKSHNIDENLLICVSAIGAYILGEYIEGIMVVMLYVIGKILEEKAVNKSRRDIKSLLELKVKKANLKVGKEIKEVKAETLKKGDVVLVRKGDIIPSDGEVIQGSSIIDTSHLTGEAIETKVEVGSKVLSGTINNGDVITVKVSNNYFDSTAYKIFELTMNATNNKAKVETKVSKIASFYTPIVLIIAILVGSLLPLISNVTYTDSITRALTFLVISCPCAIAISVPLSYFAGIGASSKAKVLVKGSNYLDTLTKCDTIVFDKTGTLTTGSFKIENIEIYDKKYTKNEVLKIMAMGERNSTHPIAKVILNEVKENIDVQEVKDFKEIEGKGITYKLAKQVIKVGSAGFVNTDKKASIFLEIDDKLIAGVTFNDNIKDNAREVVELLKKQNMRTIMLTGDNKTFAKRVGDKVNIDEYECELLPNQKFEKLNDIMKAHKVIFVGDGINDTPSLVKADVGISMGEIGSNSAIEASDVVIMNDNLEGLVNVLKIAKKTNKIIIINLVFAVMTKLIILGLATLGLANMAWAVFADTGVTLITILNSLRILKKLRQSHKNFT